MCLIDLASKFNHFIIRFQIDLMFRSAFLFARKLLSRNCTIWAEIIFSNCLTVDSNSALISIIADYFYHKESKRTNSLTAKAKNSMADKNEIKQINSDDKSSSKIVSFQKIHWFSQCKQWSELVSNGRIFENRAQIESEIFLFASTWASSIFRQILGENPWNWRSALFFSAGLQIFPLRAKAPKRTERV